MSRIPPLRSLRLHRRPAPLGCSRQVFEPPFEPQFGPQFERQLEPMPDDIDQWLETAFDASVERDELTASLNAAAPHAIAGAE